MGLILRKAWFNYMRLISGTTEFTIPEKTVVAIGKFDGFHRGHQKLMQELERQKKKGLSTLAFTFVPSPAAFFSNRNIPVQDLTTVAEKRKIFEQAQLDYLIEYPFFKEIADMEPSKYVCEVLVKQLHAKCIVAGEDVSFGKNGAGNAQLLKEMAKKYDYEVIIIDKVQYDGREVSSTYVREEVKSGNLELVKQLLGQPYHVGGVIVHGKKLGRTLGMPTVNLLPPKEKLLPPNGVYYSYVVIDKKQYPAITNIGIKPTVDDSQLTGVESYIYDFKQDIYGKEIEVYLLEYKRSEMCFESIDDLKKQMQTDVAQGRIFHHLS